jgi:hypothetical protein
VRERERERDITWGDGRMLFKNVEAVKKNVSFCKILCSYRNDNFSECFKSSGLLPCVFGQIVSSVLKDHPKLPRPEDEDTVILQNVRDYKPNDAMSHLRRNEFCYTSFDHFSTL